ncbi:MAG: trypsin-like peptidase domain-containing protein [Bdellovibrionaceae bacterium]|nr:trypsin-like peptidase domain-containing protein [Pseudobdellovibrionaceae bacterium]
MLKFVIQYFLAGLFLTTLISCAESFDARARVPDDPIVNKLDDSVENSLDERVIYGSDDRKNVYEVASSAVRKAAESTVALILSTSLRSQSALSFLLPPDSYGDSQSLCSGSLVGPNLILTAGHCVTSVSDCASVRFVFGYAVRQPNAFPLSSPSSEVYFCKRIVTRMQEVAGADYALIELDRKVTGHTPLKIQRSGAVKVGDSLTVIGHPSG